MILLSLYMKLNNTIIGYYSRLNHPWKTKRVTELENQLVKKLTSLV